MNDEQALAARRVALTASAWLRYPTDTEVYRRLVEAVAHWDALAAPPLPFDCSTAATRAEGRTTREAGTETVGEPLEELMDGAVEMPLSLGESLAGIEDAIRARARKSL